MGSAFNLKHLLSVVQVISQLLYIHYLDLQKRYTYLKLLKKTMSCPRVGYVLVPQKDPKKFKLDHIFKGKIICKFSYKKTIIF